MKLKSSNRLPLGGAILFLLLAGCADSKPLRIFETTVDGHLAIEQEESSTLPDAAPLGVDPNAAENQRNAEENSSDSVNQIVAATLSRSSGSERIEAGDADLLTDSAETVAENEAEEMDDADSQPTEDLMTIDDQASAATTCSWKPSLPAVFVSLSGSDSNAGTEVKPYRNLSKAIQAIRGTSTKRIYMRSGTYFISSTIKMTSQDNGVKINSYPCEKATLDGGQSLTSWTGVGGNVYYTVVSNPTSYTDLVAFGQRQRPATSGVYDPNQPETSSWHYVDTTVKDSAGKVRLDAFKFRSGDLDKTKFPYLTGMVVQSFPWSRQRDSWNPIKSIDWNARIIYLTSPLIDDPVSGSFRVLNNFRWIRRSGEFAWEWGTTKKLYTRQDNSTFKTNIVMPRLDTIIRIDGAADIGILNLNFQNTISKGKAIYVLNSNRISIGGNGFKVVGTGISFEKTSNSSIAGNSLDQIAASGIDLYLNCNKNKIYGNRIKNIGQVYKFVAGISFAGSSDNLVSQNDVSDSARYGISQKDFSPETINWRNTIEKNWVYNTCKETGDGGAIETLGRQANNTGTVIKNNLIERYNGLGGSPMQKGFKGFGIYLDDRSSGVTVDNNVVKNSGYAYAMVYIHGGDNNIVRYNYGIADNANNKFIRLEHTSMGQDSSGNPKYDDPKNSRIERNIVHYSAYNSDYSWYGSGGDAVVNYNLLVNTARYFEAGKTLDANSIVTKTSPFSNLSGGYTFKSGSDAAKLGIPAFPTTSLGAGNFKPTTTMPRFW